MDQHRKTHGEKIRFSNRACGLHQGQDIDMVTYIEIKRLECAGHICGMNKSRTSEKILEEKIHRVRVIVR